MKFLHCTQCGFRWNVSQESKETDETYICPKCRGRNKREELKDGKDTIKEGSGRNKKYQP